MRALENGQMSVCYQPKYSLRSNTFVGVEALVRWTHPQRGALRPDLFVQMAEGVDDATWTFHLAKGDVARWFREYIKDPDLAQEAEDIARASGSSPQESRASIKSAIERRYTMPA